MNQLAAQLQVGASISESTSVPSTGTNVPDSVQPGWNVNDDSYPPPATVDEITTPGLDANRQRMDENDADSEDIMLEGVEHNARFLQ